MGLTHDKIGTDENLAREVLVVARSIAPCIASFADNSEEQKDAIAILKRVFEEVKARGSRLVRAQRVGTASVDYLAVRSAFEGDATRALKALCAEAGIGGLPVGSFPPPSDAVANMWPEGC